MEKDFNNGNSKKIIIGVSILFCTVILIIGTTTAFFTQSDSESTGNIVSTDKVTLDYQDDDSFMFGDLIPLDEEYLDTAYNNKCKDNLGYNVCSIYQFTITNTGNVVQDIIINMHPKVNGFTNLKFNLYDITNNEQIVFNQGLTLNSEALVPLVNDLTLDTTNNKSNTYELVFYIKNDPDHDQSHLDAGVRFGANIEVNSVTTGFHIIKDLGDPGCWKADENDPSIISEFIGYADNNDNKYFDEGDELKKECEMYFKKDTDNYYIVNIPSVYAGYSFTEIGQNLLSGYNFSVGSVTEYMKIKSIDISKNIIKLGDLSFATIGSSIEDQHYTLTINLPDTLTTIGESAFILSFLNNVVIPYKVTEIGNAAFDDCSKLTSVIFAGSLTDRIESGVNKNLLSIGNHVFDGTNLIYNGTTESDYLILPARINSIGVGAFADDELKFIRYMGSRENLDKLGTEWYQSSAVVKAYGE